MVKSSRNDKQGVYVKKRELGKKSRKGKGVKGKISEKMALAIVRVSVGKSST